MATTQQHLSMGIGTHRLGETAAADDAPGAWIVLLYPFSFALTVAGILLLS